MNELAVIFWSGTGNTAFMAAAVVEGAGSQAKLVNVNDITADQAAQYDRLALGCPSMGDEVLEEDVFEPFFTALEGQLSGKKVVLFGSYDWGDGQWMRDWADRCRSHGAELLQPEGLIANEAPDEAALDACRALGEELARW